MVNTMGRAKGYQTMNRALGSRIALLVLCATFALGATARAVVIVCPIDGEINPSMAVVVERAVEKARVLEASAIVFRIDTPGGRVDSAIEITTSIQKAPCKTIAYIEGMGAISAGAVISYACNVITTTPVATMGAAQPVVLGGPTGMIPAEEKSVSFVRAKIKALADSRGHNRDIAVAMVDKDIELRGMRRDDGTYRVYSVDSAIPFEANPPPARVNESVNPIKKLLDPTNLLPGLPESPAPAPATAPPARSSAPPPEAGTVVFEDGSVLLLERGKLLTLTPEECLKYGVIETTVMSVEEALDFYDVDGREFVAITPTWAEGVYEFLTSPTIAGLLLMLGMGGLYFEVKTPGFGLPGIIGITSLALLFGSNYVLGLTDVIDVILISSGLILIVIEMFVIPGFGVAGVAGILCFIVGIYLSFVNFTFPEYSWQFQQLWDVGYTFVVAMVTFTAMLLATWRLLLKTPFYNMLVLENTQDIVDDYTVQTGEVSEAHMGLHGIASSMLRPTGRGRFGGRNVQVVTRGDFIEAGTPIVIVEADGNRYVVEQTPEDSQ